MYKPEKEVRENDLSLEERITAVRVQVQVLYVHSKSLKFLKLDSRFLKFSRTENQVSRHEGLSTYL